MGFAAGGYPVPVYVADMDYDVSGYDTTYSLPYCPRRSLRKSVKKVVLSKYVGPRHIMLCRNTLQKSFYAVPANRSMVPCCYNPRLPMYTRLVVSEVGW